MKLCALSPRRAAIVVAVEDASPTDAVARRLRELGFVAGERVEIVAKGPFGGDPLLVQVGFTRFALRRAEASRIRIDADARETVA
ncbi:FeoA family protein [Luteimonas vadosa]|uniref:FeoA family protein n=1 Tax=Luteimonas vadosa TaxID=1165507 RepID=A0ABP9E4X6_9GAMM